MEKLKNIILGFATVAKTQDFVEQLTLSENHQAEML